ncbi:IclR family transcriptional regulator [Actinopolyspora erythraea]|uniref:IclR family transcriptional regulator n=1 Tax=Actinopolyspora erythraea TaxID=414996 RepID=A0A099D8D7_9ACTN|nr:IclR family transcriptional regulator [Actinopolyspora erythraea]ASU78534.1 IclR family transcriptional regulator [Actinopolyspora erythraea]KGI82032.1 IclR family transcriptional regulator [Actinopolyspora erythraea]
MSQSLRRGLALLTELAEGPRNLDQLAEAVGVHKSTAMRLLRSLETDRFVKRSDTHHYRLGSALFELADRALDEIDVRDTARTHLLELGESTGHTVHLAVRENDQVVYVDKVDSTHAVRMYSRVGARAPLHCTAVGKVLLSEIEPARRRELVAALDRPALTDNTITDPEELLAELDRVSRSGYAVDRGEHEDFVHCIAAGVRDPRGEIVAAVSLSTPKVLLDFDELLGLTGELSRSCDRVSFELGWQPPDH